MKAWILWGATLVFSRAAVGQASPTRFSVIQQAGEWWLSSAAGDHFLSFGVCCVDPGVGFQDYDPTNPSYSAFRYYPSKSAWATATTERLKDWHFNTIGAWSDLSVSTPSLYQTPILNLGAAAGAPWKDMWSADVVKSFHKTAHEQVGRYIKNPSVIGYFSDNEMGWWEGALFDWIWKSDPKSGQRTHFVSVLLRRYKTWAAVTHDFLVQDAKSFDDLLGHGRLYLRPGGAGMKTVQDYIALVADRYYRLSRDAIKQEDPGALYLGDRYISNFYPEIAGASKPFVDVVSTNLNANWNDGTFTHFYLSSLAAITQKPILISEYYQAAKENRSGDKNDSSGFPVSTTQAERANAAEVATRYLLSQPNVVGTHWFQYYDEPAHGRGDGEDYDMGLVDTDNRPYDELTHAFGQLDLNGVHAAGPATGMDASMGIPLAPADFGELSSWNRTRGFIAPSVDSHRADAYGSYSSDALYVAVCWDEDRFAEAYYRLNEIPFEDFPQIHVRVGKAYVKVVIPPKGQIEITPNAKLVREVRGVRNELIIRIPVSTVGKPDLSAGDQLGLDIGLATRGRAYFGRWKGSFTLGNTP